MPYNEQLQQDALILVRGHENAGKHYLFCVPVKFNQNLSRFKSNDEDASTANMVTMSDTLYWINDVQGKLVATKIDWRNNVTRANWLGLKTPSNKLVLNQKTLKTPLHYTTRKYTEININKMLSDLEIDIRRIPNVYFKKNV